MKLRTMAVWSLGGCAFLALFSDGRAQGPSSPGKKHQPDNGIFVDYPKVYDDGSLTALLQAAQSSLSSLSPFDNPTLLKGLGAIQGANVDQTASNVQLSAGKGATAPSLPTTTSAMSAPAAPGMVSAGDLLNEETQLDFEIVSLRLLLQGALS